MRTILAIETSCDETAASVVRDGRVIVSNVVASQIDMHRKYGGVFPELASREHVRVIAAVIEEALASLPGGLDEVEAVAVTHGPGLAGSLLVGVNAAKGLAFGRGLPLLAIHHLLSHIYANWLIPPDHDQTEPPPPEPRFPLLVLVVSGGHTDLVLMRDHNDYSTIGRTIDDAAGEAFDKVGRLLGLPYPGGPEIERSAARGVAETIDMPRMRLRDAYNFSFSGLKTAALRIVQSYTQDGEEADPSRLPVSNIAAAFQESVVEALVSRTVEAAQEHGVRQVLLAGGVAANSRLRQAMAEALKGVNLLYPPKRLCTDNAAMVAAAAFYQQEWTRAGWDLDVLPSLGLATC
ncbi:MAG: tRNA (adenosine(37)-N6)-threonylcarbamoyltransferase complex transferase subunit TsaD [Anaerolineae bacterium]